MAEEAEEKVAKVAISLHGTGGDDENAGGLFDDKDTRTFYETLPDLMAALPAVLFGEGGEADRSEQTAESFEAQLKQLPGCTSSEMVDEVASNLVCSGARTHRRKLVRSLLQPPRQRPEVLPHYARLAATLSLCFKHVDTELASLLKQEFDELAERNRPAELELRLNNARYLGELVKFKLLPPAAFFGCLKACVDAFSAPNALVACTLLESCGRYLHRAKETQPRVDAMLELLTKLRSAHRGRLPSELATQLENAVASCKPPERSAMVAEVLSPMHAYVRTLLHRTLTKTTVEHVIKQLRKLPWGDGPGSEAEGWVHPNPNPNPNPSPSPNPNPNPNPDPDPDPNPTPTPTPTPK